MGGKGQADATGEQFANGRRGKGAEKGKNRKGAGKVSPDGAQGKGSKKSKPDGWYEPGDRRIYPVDGKAYTYNQVFYWLFQEQNFSPQQIDWAWSRMVPLRPLRFQQGDRVLCNIGERRLAGVVIEVNVEDPDDPSERIPYVIKTDAYPGIPSSTISAPCDDDETICRDRCFEASSEECDLARWASPVVAAGRRQSLRFAHQDSVCIRVRDSADGNEHWIPGQVVELWPGLRGEPGEGFLVSAESVPYLVLAQDDTAYYCHLDDHTLIRKPENAPKVPVKGISKRFEHRKLPDGSVERFDHVTLRSRKRVESDSDCDSD